MDFNNQFDNDFNRNETLKNLGIKKEDIESSFPRSYENKTNENVQQQETTENINIAQEIEVLKRRVNYLSTNALTTISGNFQELNEKIENLEKAIMYYKKEIVRIQNDNKDLQNMLNSARVVYGGQPVMTNSAPYTENKPQTNNISSNASQEMKPGEVDLTKIFGSK